MHEVKLPHSIKNIFMSLNLLGWKLAHFVQWGLTYDEVSKCLKCDCNLDDVVDLVGKKNSSFNVIENRVDFDKWCCDDPTATFKGWQMKIVSTKLKAFCYLELWGRDISFNIDYLVLKHCHVDCREQEVM